MRADDPRHGTQAGYEQHARDGETPCEDCHHGYKLAARRRQKRKTMGYVYTCPIGEANWSKLDRLNRKGIPMRVIAEWAGLVDSQIARMLTNGPEYVVYARTYVRVRDMQIGEYATPTGITRRIRALTWLGYSARRIAEEAGVHKDTIGDARRRVLSQHKRDIIDAIAAAYDRLHMTVPVATDERDQAAISRMRNMAAKQGWAPPLAWDDIDDPDEKPAAGWKPATRKRDHLAEFRHLTGLGVAPEEAARQLGVQLESIDRYEDREAARGRAS